MGKIGGGALRAKKPLPFWPLLATPGRGQTISGAAAMAVPSSIGTGTPAPAIRLPLDPAPTHPRERPFPQESSVRLGLQARSSTMRRWGVAEETGAFLIEAAYDARRHHKRLPHIGKLLLRRPAFSSRGPPGSSSRSRRSTRWRR